LLLLLVAVVIVNALRFRPAPAQGNGPPPARSGDTNCDGKIDITDPIIVLNWLFSDGPEPCAIAQGDACCESLREEIASLRAEVAARMPRPDDILAVVNDVRFEAHGSPKVIIDVPEGKRFVVTNYQVMAYGGYRPLLASMIDGVATEIPARELQFNVTNWPSGYAFPAGSDVAFVLPSYDNPANANYFLNGYFVAE
jgi:hypothetical protein